MGSDNKMEEATSEKSELDQEINSIENMQNKEAKEKIKANLKKVVMAIIGTLSAGAIPVWQIYFVETSDVTVEISSITRNESDSANIELATDELEQLELYIPVTLLYEYDKQGKRGDKLDFPKFSISILLKAFDKAKQDIKNIADTNNALRGYQAQIDKFIQQIDPDYQLQEFRIANLKSWNLNRYIEDKEAAYYETQLLAITRNYSSMKFTDDGIPVIDLDAIKSLLVDVDEELEEVSADNIARLNRLRDDIRSIESQLDKLKQSQSEKYSYFSIEVVVSNDGRASTSMRPLALMRVQISEDNYADVNLLMDNYKENAELAAASTKIIRYTSDQLITFPKEDQRMVNNFWRSTAWFRVYTMDTSQHVFTSNRVAFADNLNQKVIFDRLKDRAADNMTK